MKKYLLVCAIALIAVFTGFGQSSLTEEEVTELTELSFELSGTYQIQMIDTRSKPTIPLVTFREIDFRRHTANVVYYELNPNTRIKIYPTNAINNPSFVTPEAILYVNSSDL
jgi:hypothetical protein